MDVQPAFIKGTKRLNDEAKVLFVETQDAYSFSRYGEKSWMANIKFLLTKFAPNQVEWILRHKHMRWAADFYEARGRIPMKTMEMYYAAGDLNDGEMPDPVDTRGTDGMSYVEKLARIRVLREEMLCLQREVDEA